MYIVNISFFAAPQDTGAQSMIEKFVDDELAMVLTADYSATDIVLSRMERVDPESADCFPLHFTLGSPEAMTRWQTEGPSRVAGMLTARFGAMRIQMFPTVFHVIRRY